VDRFIRTAPRFIRETVEWNLKIAHRKQPWLALGAAIGLQGVLAARRICDSRDIRTNLYIVGVCGSGRGKDSGRQVVVRVLEAAEASDLLGPEALTSGAALASHLNCYRAGIFQLDEFGRMLVTMGNPAKSPHLYELTTTMMRLKTSANSRAWKGKGYADTEKNIEVDQPHVVLHGTTTQCRLFEALTGADVLDGSLARMLFFFGDEDPPEPDYRRQSTGQPPESVVQHAAGWNTFEPGHLHAAIDGPDSNEKGNLLGLGLGWEHPEPLVVPHDEDAMDRAIEWCRRWDARIRESEQFAPLWSRTGEHAAGIALTACAARGIPTEETRITLADVEWAYELTDILVTGLVDAVRDHIADGPADRLRKKVVLLVKKSPGISRSELLKKTKASRRDLDEAVDWLSETAEIHSHREASGPHGGRPKIRYYPKGYPVQQQ